MPAAIRLTVLMCVFLAVLSEDTSTTSTPAAPVAASIPPALTTAGGHDTSKASVTAVVTSAGTDASSQSVTRASVTSPAASSSSPKGSSSSSPTPGRSPSVHTTHTQLTTHNDTVGTTTNHTSTVTHSPLPTHQPKWTSTPHPSTAGVVQPVYSAGLIAVLCIFCIVLALGLVVCIIKTVQSRKRSSFERLEDVPMGKVNEDSPISHYSR